MSENPGTGQVEGELYTTGGMLGMKEVLCRVVVGDTHLAISTGRRTEALRFSDMVGTERTEFRTKPWGPTIVQLVLKRATSNQFGGELLILRTTNRSRKQGVELIDLIERYARAPKAVDAASEGSDPSHVLRGLAALRDEGILTDEEFAAKKRSLLGLE